MSADGMFVYKAKVPDTITSWTASAFAMNDQSGVGVAPHPANLQVFRNFFIRLNLPYSVKRGEKLALQVLVFNYGDADQDVTVELDHNDKSGFEIVKKSRIVADSKTSKYSNMRKIKVKGGGGTESVYFPIVPTTVGDVKILVKAFGQSTQDAIEKSLLVEPEGVRLFFNKPVIIDLSKAVAGTFNQTISTRTPPAILTSIIKGSESIEFSLIGDIMGPLLSSLEDLVRMPYGCGEQNMLGFVPNIVVRRYLEATGKATTANKYIQKTTKYMEAGYQRELQYRRVDNSFSAFGDNDAHGSTWLTAFVVRSFQDAKRYIFIDDVIVKKSVKFLLKQQKENGEFQEAGEVHHKAMQGGSGASGVPLTAYVTLALLKSGMTNKEAIDYLEQSLDKIADDPYALAIVAYVLQLANSAQKDKALQLLNAKAVEKDGMRHWESQVGHSPQNQTSTRAWWYDGPRPVDVEMTSYAILAHMARDEVSQAFPSIRWLSSKRNSLGGFASTQDTVIGITALGAYAEKTFVEDINLKVDVEQAGQTTSLTVNRQSAAVLQKSQLSSLKSPVTIRATGKGMAFAQVSWHYNVPKMAEEQAFQCTQDLDETESGTELNMQLCCRYGLEGRSNMAVIELSSPSGYKIDGEKLHRMPALVKDLQRVELSKEDTAAAVYFNSIGNYPACVNITGQKVFQVSEQKPSQIRVFDYYEPEKAVQLEYSASRKVSLEQQCENCWQELTDADVVDHPQR
jgi:CD109 antigen